MNIAFSEDDRQLLRMVAEGKTNLEIGRAFGITRDGAKKRIQALADRMDAPQGTNRTVLCGIAFKKGLIW